MPLYRWRCFECNEPKERFMSVLELESFDPPKCPRCDSPMPRDFTDGTPKIFEGSREKNLYPYTNTLLTDSPVRVESRKHEDAILRATGQIRTGPSEGAKYRSRHSRRRFY